MRKQNLLTLLILAGISGTAASAADLMDDKFKQDVSPVNSKITPKAENKNSATMPSVKTPAATTSPGGFRPPGESSATSVKPSFKRPAATPPLGVKPGFKEAAPAGTTIKPQFKTPASPGTKPGFSSPAVDNDPGSKGKAGFGSGVQPRVTGVGGKAYDSASGVKDVPMGGVAGFGNGVQPNATGEASGGFYEAAQESFSSGGEATYTLGNGQQVPRTDGAGGLGVPDDKGGVAYPDGTYIAPSGDGGTNVFNPDGTRDAGHSRPGSSGSFYEGAEESFSSGGEATYTLGNGQQVPRTDGAGGLGMPDDKGGVLYPDGTYIAPDEDGGTGVYNPDGSRNERDSRPGTSNDSSENSDSSNNDSDSSNDDSDSGNDDSDDNDDSSNDDDTDDSSESTDDSSSSEEEDTDTEAADESQTGHGTGSYGSYTSEGKQAVDSAAQPGNNEVESTAPGPCGDEEGGMVMDQQEAENCAPAVGGGDDDDSEEPSTPGASNIWQAPSSSSGVDMVVQPGVDGEQFNDEGVAPLESIGRGIESVTNPGGN